MAKKTLLLTGMTTGSAAGNAGIEGAIDITAPVIGVYPEVAEAPVTEGKYSTIKTTITPEGGFKYLLNRKVHLNKFATTNGIHEDANAAGGKTIGAVSTANFKKSKKDKFEFEMDKSWDAGFIYDKKKDPAVTEGKLIDDLGSLQSDLREDKAVAYYTTIDSDISASGKSTKFDKFVSSEDDKTKDAPVLLSTITIAKAATTQDEKEFISTQIIDGIFAKIAEQRKMGAKGSAFSGFPYGRSGRNIGAKVTVKEELLVDMSHDPRFKYTGATEDQIKSGKPVAMINAVPVILDPYMDDNATKFDIEISGTGQFSPVIKGEELPESFLLFDHPTKPTRAQLLEGSGGYDTTVTPYINFSRFIKVTIAAPTK